MKYPNITIKKCKEESKGHGVFSLTDIPEDTLICEYIGNIMTKQEIKQAKLVKDDIFELFINKNK